MHTPAGLRTTTQAVSDFGMMPLVHVDGTHALLVIGAYVLVFTTMTASVLMRTRDVDVQPCGWLAALSRATSGNRPREKYSPSGVYLCDDVMHQTRSMPLGQLRLVRC